VILPPKEADGPNSKPNVAFLYQQDAPTCSDCGSIMVRNGACYKCLNCGTTSGCS
jgi:ribonucleoside-diphosphate reductase alpha chain